MMVAGGPYRQSRHPGTVTATTRRHTGPARGFFMRGDSMADEVKEKLIRWVTPVVIALLGGLARQAKDHRDGVEFSWWGFLSRLVIAAFAGLLTMLMCREYGLSDQMTGTVAGVAGYSGVEAIECIKRFVSGRYRA